MAANFGELVLIVGDHHIPMRAHSIPAPFRKMLVPGKMQHVLCTGNLGCPEEYDRLRKLVGGSASNVHCVAGEYDFASTFPPPHGFGGVVGGGGGGGGGDGGNNTTSSEMGEYASSSFLPSFPETRVVNLGEFRVGIIGGHQVVPWGDLSALAMIRRRMDVDVLVCGRRRKEGIVEYEGACDVGKGERIGLAAPLLGVFVITRACKIDDFAYIVGGCAFVSFSSFVNSPLTFSDAKSLFSRNEPLPSSRRILSFPGEYIDIQIASNQFIDVHCVDDEDIDDVALSIPSFPPECRLATYSLSHILSLSLSHSLSLSLSRGIIGRVQ